jgi:hypothetical protein
MSAPGTLASSVGAIVSLVTALGVGSAVGTFFGAFFQSRFEHRKHLNEQEHELKRRRYLCILILMLAKLDPKTGLRHLHDHRPDLQDLDDLDAEIRTELFNAVLFASDEVVSSMAEFIRKPEYRSYVSTAAAMRRDLWNKKTSINETALKVVSEEMFTAAQDR